MSKNYLIYPTKTMNLTQTHTMGNHAGHSSGSPKDYPFDDACDSSGRSWFYCPCDEMKIVKIYGVGASGVNTVWMTSISPVVMPCGTDYITIMVEHPEDDDLRKLSVGQVFKRGQQMFREGGNGAKGAGTYGNHFHISCGTGQMSGGGWKKNSEGAWVLTVTGEPKIATACFYLDGTTIKNDRTYSFKNKPTEEKPVKKVTTATKEDDDYMTGEQIYKELMKYLESLPTSSCHKKASKAAIKNGTFTDGNKDGYVDDPRCFVTREQLAQVLYNKENAK